MEVRHNVTQLRPHVVAVVGHVHHAGEDSTRRRPRHRHQDRGVSPCPATATAASVDEGWDVPPGRGANIVPRVLPASATGATRPPTSASVRPTGTRLAPTTTSAT